jgi:uncharacterized protein YggT (Ycf19 family)
VAGVFVTYIFGEFEASAGSAVTVILTILAVAIIIAIIVITIIACVQAFKMLNVIKKNTEHSIKLKTWAMSIGIILGIITYVGSLIVQVISLVATPILNDALGKLLVLEGGIVPSSGVSPIAIISAVITILSKIAIITFWVMAFIAVSKVKKACLQPKVDILLPPEIDPPTTLLEGKITCIRGSDIGFSYPIKGDEELIIGKDPRFASIVVDRQYRQVSRKHCGIKFDGESGNYLIVDYSSNGTYIKNGNKLVRGIFATVPEGSIICLANDDVQFRLG